MKQNHLIRISTRNLPRQTWLEMRRGAIGGSDAAAILGLHPYSSPYSVWADKTGRLPDKPDNEAMRLGRDLEEYVAARWREATGKRTHRVHAMLYNRELPFAHANIDRWVVGENAGLECKTTSVLNLKRFKGGDYPDRYYAQCVHYMAVTGAARWYLAVLVLNQGLFHYVIERDEEEIAALLRQERAFWALVESNTPPQADGASATGEALKSIYAGGGGEIELAGQEALLDRYAELNAKKAETEKQLERIKQELMAKLQNAECAVCGDWTVTWKPVTRRTLDAQALRQAFPQVPVEKFTRASVSRVLRIAKRGGKGGAAQ